MSFEINFEDISPENLPDDYNRIVDSAVKKVNWEKIMFLVDRFGLSIEDNPEPDENSMRKNLASLLRIALYNSLEVLESQLFVILIDYDGEDVLTLNIHFIALSTLLDERFCKELSSDYSKEESVLKRLYERLEQCIEEEDYETAEQIKIKINKIKND